MAIFFSDILTDINNGVIIDAGEVSGNLLIATATFNITVEPQVGDIFMACDIPSSAKIKSLITFNEDLSQGATGQMDLGIYASSRILAEDNSILYLENDVIQADTFTEGSILIRGNNPGTDLRYDRFGSAFEDLGQYQNADLQLWELAGSANLPRDPFSPLRIGAVMVEGFDGFDAGTALIQITYTGKI